MGVDAPRIMDVGVRAPKLGGLSSKKKTQKDYNRIRDRKMVQGTFKFAYPEDEIAQEYEGNGKKSDTINHFK